MKWNHPAARKHRQAESNPQYCPMATDGEHEWHHVVLEDGTIIKTLCVLCGRNL